MLNCLKLREGFFGVFIILTIGTGIVFGIAQLVLTIDSFIGHKEFATETQTIEYVIKKDNKVFKKTYELKVHVDEEGIFYATTLSSAGETLK